jgi:hypothetical protein
MEEVFFVCRLLEVTCIVIVTTYVVKYARHHIHKGK